MKNFIHSTYHFEKDPPGDAPDEAGPRRELQETINLLSIGLAPNPPLSGPDQRAVNAMTSGFTMAQWRRFRKIVDETIEARRARANALEAGTLRDTLLASTDQITRRWRSTERDLEQLVLFAEVERPSGLEPNAEERRAAKKEKLA